MPRGWPSIWGRRSPDGSCGRPEGWAAPLSPDRGRPRPGCALLFGLAPGRVCRVSLRPKACADGRHRHCGTGPRLTADGRYPLPCACGARTFLTLERVAPPNARPSDRLADRLSLPRLRSRLAPHRRAAPPVTGSDAEHASAARRACGDHLSKRPAGSPAIFADRCIRCPEVTARRHFIVVRYTG